MAAAAEMTFTGKELLEMTPVQLQEALDLLRQIQGLKGADVQEPAAGGSRSVNTESKTPAVQEPVAAGSGSVYTDQESIRRALRVHARDVKKYVERHQGVAEHNVRAHLKNKVVEKLGRVLSEDELAEHRENTDKCFDSDEFRKMTLYLTPKDEAAELGWNSTQNVVSFGVLKQKVPTTNKKKKIGRAHV